MKIDPYCQRRNCSPICTFQRCIDCVDIARRYSARGRQTTVKWQKQVFIDTRLSRAYLALARLSCPTSAIMLQSYRVELKYSWETCSKFRRMSTCLYFCRRIVIPRVYFGFLQIFDFTSSLHNTGKRPNLSPQLIAEEHRRLSVLPKTFIPHPGGYIGPHVDAILLCHSPVPRLLPRSSPSI